MSTKHIYPSTDGLVLKSLRGGVLLNPSLVLQVASLSHPPSKTVYTKPSARSPGARVSVIAGGGSGHEPAHIGYTGRGMLAASVCGDVFASPSAKQIVSAIEFAALPAEGPDTDVQRAARRRDVLVVINNYTGDRLNFGLAIEKAKAMGIRVDSVVVADDVSLVRAAGVGLVGPRGLAGNIFVCKILGALADEGGSLEDVKRVGDIVVGNLASVGIGLEHCHVPGREGGEGLEGSVYEIGLGLHNEPGVRKLPLNGAEEMVRNMLELIMESPGQGDGARFPRESEVVLFVNNLGGISQLEMGAVLGEIVRQLGDAQLRPARIYMSSYMTSLNAPGFSISLLNLTSVKHMMSTIPGPTFDVVQLLDMPTDAYAWVGTSLATNMVTQQGRRGESGESGDSFTGKRLPTGGTNKVHEDGGRGGSGWEEMGATPTRVQKAIQMACRALLEAERKLTEFDTIAGDGDCGETFSAGANGILTAIDKGEIDIANLAPMELFARIADILEDKMGGTIGALLAIFFTSLSLSLGSPQNLEASHESRWGKSLSDAATALGRYTPAKEGDRTIMDALVPFIRALERGSDMKGAVDDAKAGAEATRGMRAKLGRAVYVGTEHKDVVSVPDPGAWGIMVVLQGIMEGL
ncbi:hypothetical protein BD779DRAFT_1459135 [Infundibulicybe gibba]|nr:hypothetical protein BD779DRAFT_1459135 [Infundibulicybe gibba]